MKMLILSALVLQSSGALAGPGEAPEVPEEDAGVAEGVTVVDLPPIPRRTDLAVETEGPRPILYAAMAVERACQVAIGYEDVPLVHAGELAAWTRQPGWPVVLDDIDCEDVDGTLQALVSAHRQQGLPGQFEVQRVGESRWTLVPVATRQEDGTWRPVDALTLTTVDVPASAGVLTGDVVALIIKSMEEQHGIRVDVGPGMPSWLGTPVAALSTPSGSDAAKVLHELLADIDGNWSFALLTDPHHSGGYTLNLYEPR